MAQGCVVAQARGELCAQGDSPDILFFQVSEKTSMVFKKFSHTISDTALRITL